jgi:hypothetical protein
LYILGVGKQSENGAKLTTTAMDSSVSIEDTLLTGSVYAEQPATESVADVSRDNMQDSFGKSNTLNDLDATSSDTNTDHSYSKLNTENTDDSSNGVELKSTLENTAIDGQNQTNLTDINSLNISEHAGNSTNKTQQPFWSCVKYNMTQQHVILLKDKNSLIWWLDELNKTMGCAVVLFYAKWCYFSASIAPMYNTVGRAFSGIPILAIDAYTHNR